MTVQGQLKEMLKAVAVALGDELRARLVFVGDCTRALYITDPITLEGVRATDDVDLIVDLAGIAEWAELIDQLRQRNGCRGLCADRSALERPATAPRCGTARECR